MKKIRLILPFVALLSFGALISCNDLDDGVNAPVVYSMSYRGVFDEVITAKGENFSSNISENKVTFDNKVSAEVLSATPTSITFKVPRILDKEFVNFKIETPKNSVQYTFKYNMDLCDSVLFSELDWSVNTLREGVVMKAAMGTFFGAPQSYFVLTINPSEANKIGIYHVKQGRMTVSDQSQISSAFAAVNGSYYDSTDEGTTSHAGFVRVNGEDLYQGEAAASSTFSNGAFTIDATNTQCNIKSIAGNTAAQSLTDHNVIVGGPLLLYNGVPQSFSASSTHNTSRHPRTIVGITKDGKVMLVTIDGRFSLNAVGATTEEMIKVMRMLGAHSALNLDGGGSTTMWVKSIGVVNYPCDNSVFDHNGERSVKNSIYVK